MAELTVDTLVDASGPGRQATQPCQQEAKLVLTKFGGINHTSLPFRASSHQLRMKAVLSGETACRSLIVNETVSD